jgi:hypothetical protein
MTDTDPIEDQPPGDPRPEDQPQPPAEDGPALPSLPMRFMQVFVSPGELFARLQHKPAWVGAMILGGVLVGLATYLIPVELTLELTRQQFAERGQELPAGFESGAKYIRLAGMIFGPLFWALFAVVTTGIVTVIFTFLLGGEGKFKQYLSIVAHAYLISAVSYLALVPLRISAGDPQLLLSVGTLIPIGGDAYLGKFLGLIDLFGLWTWAVVGLGVSTITKKLSWGTAAAILMVIPVGFAALFAIWA